jgi:hypothetical protein
LLRSGDVITGNKVVFLARVAGSDIVGFFDYKAIASNGTVVVESRDSRVYLEIECCCGAVAIDDCGVCGGNNEA